MHALLTQGVRRMHWNALVVPPYAMSLLGLKHLDCAGQKQSLILAAGGQLTGTTLRALLIDMWTMPLA